MKPVLMSSRTEQELLIWQSQSKYTDPEDFIFCREKGFPVSRKTVSRRFMTALKRAKIEIEGRKIIPYSLRHALNTDMLEKTGIQNVQLLIGHTTQKMTGSYNRTTGEGILKQLQDLQPLIDERWSSTLKRKSSSSGCFNPNLPKRNNFFEKRPALLILLL